MNRSSRGVPLKHKNAHAPHCRRILLDNGRTVEPRQNLAYRYTIFSKLVIAVIRNTDCASHRKDLNLSECIAQFTLASRLTQPPRSRRSSLASPPSSTPAPKTCPYSSAAP